MKVFLIVGLLAIAVVVMLSRCSVSNKEYKTDLLMLKDYFKQTTSERFVNHMTTNLREAILEMSKTVTPMMAYQTEPFVVSNEILLNEDKSKAIMFAFSNSGKANKDGYVQMFVAWTTEDDKWMFTGGGKRPVFSYGFSEKIKGNVPFTAQELYDKSWQSLIEDGLIRRGKISQKYINTKWF